MDKLYYWISFLFPRQLLYWSVLRAWEITSNYEEGEPDFDDIPLNVVCKHLDKYSIKNNLRLSK